VKGRVVDVHDNRAYVRIAPELDVMLPADQVPIRDGQSLTETLWIGDQVVGIITHVPPNKKQPWISLSQYLDRVNQIKMQARSRAEARRQTEHELASEAVAAFESEGVGADTVQEEWIAPDVVHQVHHILVIDDDPGFSQPFCEWLGRIGYTVQSVETARSGLEMAKTNTGIDAIFVDVHLPDGNGLQVAREVLETRSSMPIVIITGLDWFQLDLDLEGLNIVDLFLKPPSFDEIEALLQAVATGKWVRRRPIKRFRGQIAELQRQTGLTTSIQTSWKQSVDTILHGLVGSTKATCAVLFSMDPITEKVEIEGQAGVAALATSYDWTQARRSPIRDVIQDGKRIHESDAKDSRSEKEFYNLHRLLNFTSCIGLPVVVPERPTRYGLFLFHPHLQYFTKEHFAQALLSTQALAMTIEREELAQIEHAFHQFSLAGQLGAGLVHEMRNMLAGLEYATKNLELTTEELTADEITKEEALQNLQDHTHRFAQLSGDLRELFHFYLGLIRPEGERVFDINQMLAELKQRLHLPARDNHVEIFLEVNRDMPQVNASRPRLQQACLNVMLNAIQHIGLYDPHGGLLVVSTHYENSSTPLPIKISIADNGPGIHYKMFDSIFERGTSTRAGGSGLGLFMSRSLIKSLGGKISVEDSTLFVGSNFLIELPAALVEGGSS
jgi:signal transduction histidine kinase/CheY-like chemotaxis protein